MHLKIGNKRRRTMGQIQADKDETILKQKAIEDKLIAYEQIQARAADLEAQVERN